MGKYFGTDGFRGEANEVLTVEHAYKVGRFIGHYFSNGKNAKVVIGKDTRRSSYMFEYALVAGLTASGADVYLLHVTTTPSVAYTVKTEDFDCGIMISASHNPFYDNGIKIINASGQKLEKEVEDKIEEYIDQKEDNLPLAKKEKIGRTTDYSAGRNRYIGYLISLATRSFKGYKVGLDCSNGSAFTIAKNVFDALGAKTFVINAEPDGLNINKDCGSTHVDILAQYVKDNNLDIGFAYDGDADRCIAVDENGEIVDGDSIMYVCAVHMKNFNELAKDTVVTTIMSNIGLYLAFDEKNINYEKTDVGDKYVCENMFNNGYSLGGEQSGHIIYGKYATTGDGILTSLKVMEAVVENKTTLSQLTKELKIFPQVLENVKIEDKATVMNDPDINDALNKIEAKLGKMGRILLRPSGTEPLIRVMVEAKTKEICLENIKIITDIIKEKGYAKS